MNSTNIYLFEYFVEICIWNCSTCVLAIKIKAIMFRIWVIKQEIKNNLTLKIGQKKGITAGTKNMQLNCVDFTAQPKKH